MNEVNPGMEAQAAILVWATRLARHWCGSAYLVRLTLLAPLVEAVVSVEYALDQRKASPPISKESVACSLSFIK